MCANSRPRTTAELPRFDCAFEHGSSVESRSYAPLSEWLLPDGKGGFAMGSIASVPLRRYHGLLCASLTPPVRRIIALAAIDEHLHLPNAGPCGVDLDIRLTGFQFASQDEPPAINPYLRSFSKSHDRCRWAYTIPTSLGALGITRTLTVADERSACRIGYEIESAFESEHPLTIELRPLVAMRDFHHLNAPGSMGVGDFEIAPIDDSPFTGVRLTRGTLDATLAIRSDGFACARAPALWKGVRYHHETLRGQSDVEDLLCPCVLSVTLPTDRSHELGIEAWIENDDRQGDGRENGGALDWRGASGRKSERIGSSIEHALLKAGDPDDPALRGAIARLAQAADDFIVTRARAMHDLTSIIAGYPWFSDWGRDTMIALPGLLLATGRCDEAARTLTTFARAMLHGLIPNRFDDGAGPAHYNTADASLWFIHACARWAEESGRGLDPELLAACDAIIDAYINGTINRIRLDESDGLIAAGDASTQLTWMDALRSGVAFTPRHGKAIEINALWINALESRIGLETQQDSPRANRLGALASRARSSLVSSMTRGPDGGLVDCLTPESGSDSSRFMRSLELRPNQIFACSLPLVRLPAEIVRASIDAVGSALLTPVGLRTLDPRDPAYVPHYVGSMMDRDRAYHNGCVWPWLLGPYCEALMRAGGFDEHSRAKARSIMLTLVSKMDTDSVGQLFEIYDAEPDEQGRFAPQGCVAQAWSIGEALRVLVMSSAGA